ncbi:hypothetical protein [Nostoc sp.]
MANRAWGRQCGLGVSPSGATAVMAKKLLSSQCPKGWGEQPRPPTQGN